MIKPISFRRGVEVSCLFSYGGESGLTKNIIYKCSLFSDFKNTEIFGILNVHLNTRVTFSKQNMTCVKELKLWEIKQVKNSDSGTVSVFLCPCRLFLPLYISFVIVKNDKSTIANEISKFDHSFRFTCLACLPPSSVHAEPKVCDVTGPFPTFYCRKLPFSAKEWTTLTVLYWATAGKGRNILGITMKDPATPSVPWTAVGEPAM